ncbi:hypothetical protein AX774_g1977, partial [Zancudomyces culisetae]
MISMKDPYTGSIKCHNLSNTKYTNELIFANGVYADVALSTSPITTSVSITLAVTSAASCFNRSNVDITPPSSSKIFPWAVDNACNNSISKPYNRIRNSPCILTKSLRLLSTSGRSCRNTIAKHIALNELSVTVKFTNVTREHTSAENAADESRVIKYILKLGEKSMSCAPNRINTRPPVRRNSRFRIGFKIGSICSASVSTMAFPNLSADSKCLRYALSKNDVTTSACLCVFCKNLSACPDGSIISGSHSFLFICESVLNVIIDEIKSSRRKIPCRVRQSVCRCPNNVHAASIAIFTNSGGLAIDRTSVSIARLIPLTACCASATAGSAFSKSANTISFRCLICWFLASSSPSWSWPPAAVFWLLGWLAIAGLVELSLATCPNRHSNVAAVLPAHPCALDDDGDDDDDDKWVCPCSSKSKDAVNSAPTWNNACSDQSPNQSNTHRLNNAGDVAVRLAKPSPSGGGFIVNTTCRFRATCCENHRYNSSGESNIIPSR